ncbi:UrcA family protein [Rhizorhabdus argentea]|uniref:UrcA family protein n=1 Tax=Rhizorhabdus argentea TaxID=1387174 RepID=UPI0030EE395D
MIKYALIALACSAGLSTAALAAPEDIAVAATDALTRTATVNIADLDLNQARGKVVLHSRLKQAVRAVCETDAACNYQAERETARLASNAIAAASGEMASAMPTRLMVRGAR